MLKVAYLLPIYRGFEAIRNKIAWLSFNKCLGLRFSAKPTKNVAISFKFLSRIRTKGLFDARVVKSEEFGVG